jgi:NAD(P) transhydrogenase
MREYDLICIGSGPAGEKAATQASYFGYRTAIIERAPQPGGAMVNTGTVPSKALRETALLCSGFKRRPLPGMEFCVDHQVSITQFMARRHLIEIQERDRIESSIDRHSIDVHRGHGRITGPHTVAVEAPDGGVTELRGRNILIATGSSPLRPSHIPFDHPCVVDADGVLELDRLPESMIIVGGGVIGCEYASIFAEMDVGVNMILTDDTVLPFIDPDCRRQLLQSMEAAGMGFRFNTSVDKVSTPNDETVTVELADGTVLVTHVLLWAAGRRSNTTDIGLDSVGIETNDRGLVIVDENYQTAVPSIYAAGDVVGFPALAATSMEQGRIAACHMFDVRFKEKLSRVMPFGLYTIPAISQVGMDEAGAREAGHDVVVGLAKYKYNVRGRMLGDETGLLKCVFERSTKKLLGSQIVGQDATEIIHLAQFAIEHGVGVDYFIDSCFNYPSLTELYKYAAYSALQQMAGSEVQATPVQSSAA